MRIRASFTVENSILIPLFTIIIVLFLRVGLNMHDEVVENTAFAQVCISSERQGRGDKEFADSTEGVQIVRNACEYINKRSMISNLDETIFRNRLKTESVIKNNNQAAFIRKTNAFLKLKGD